MKIDVIDNYRNFSVLKKEWNDLLKDTGEENIFLRHEWFDCWLKSYGAGHQLHIIMVSDHGKLIAIAPLMIVTEKYRFIRLRKIKFIENSDTLHCGFIIVAQSADAIKKIFDHLIENEALWDLIDLQHLPQDCSYSELLKEYLSGCDLLCVSLPGLQSPYIVVDKDWETYWKSRTRKFRKNCKRKIKKIAQDHDYSVSTYDTLKDVREDIHFISANSWKSKIGQAIPQSESRIHFFDTLGEIAAANHWLKVSILSINGARVAHEFHLEYKNRVHSMRSDYVEKYKHLSPGSVLDFFIVENIFKSGVTEYDLGGSNDDYKLNWTSDIRAHTHYLIFNRGIKGALLFLLEAYIVRWAKRIIQGFQDVGKNLKQYA